MPRNWRSRTLGMVGIGALVVGAGLVVAAPADAAPVADANALRAAISNANGTGPATQIELSPGVTYSLPGSGGCADDDTNAAGDLDIARNQPLTIFTADGQEPAVLEMTCDPATTPQRVIQVDGAGGDPAGKLTLRNVVIRGGHAPDSRGDANGGAVLSSNGDVELDNTTFLNNTAGNGADGAPGGVGGAVAAGGAVTIDHSTFSGNAAGPGGDGCEGGIGGNAGAVIAGAGMTVTDSNFTGNAAGGGAKGSDGCGADSQGGNGGLGGSGGAIQCGFILSGPNGIQRIGCDGSMTVRGSTFSGNTTGSGGNGGNGAGGLGGNGGPGGLGGAILFVGKKLADGTGTLLVENSTVDGNSSGHGGTGGNGSNGGDGGQGGHAGAIVAGFADRSTGEVAKLVHDTITDNGGGGTGGTGGTAATGGAGGRAGDAGGGGVQFLDLWASVATVIGSGTENDGPDCWAPANSSTLSRATDADNNTTGCGFGTGSVLPFDGFALGSLSDNGGPTQTRLPGANSTLVDKVVGVTGEPATDQRGVSRPQSAGADIGAVEVQLIDMAVTKTASAQSVAAGTEVTFTITTKNTGSNSPQPGVVIEDQNCANLSAAQGDANANNTLDPGETFTFTCTATPDTVGTFTNTATATITDGAGVKISRTASVDVQVTEAVGANSPGSGGLANTGTNNPTPELMTGAWLISGGIVLMLLARPRRLRVRQNIE